MNIQPIEKQDLNSSGALEVHSIFYTIQGEGPYAGCPAVFVRLAGCNLKCPGCDTDYTSHRSFLAVSLIVSEIQRAHEHASHKPIVVISGGEPLRQNIGPLIRKLVSEHQYKVQLETNGSLFVDGIPWDSITVICSPKTGKLAPRLVSHIDAYKYVMAADNVDLSDGLPIFALDHSASPRVARPPADNHKPVYLQPMDAGVEGVNDDNLQACIQSCMKHGYTLQVQIHKIIGVE